ncbi:MAG: hypothetical protein Q7K39_01995 [Candidatus Magasanikbacteria bacterium]|nr:hypothetical protein [Candidatus Magasanikbacteria bacterium]
MELVFALVVLYLLGRFGATIFIGGMKIVFYIFLGLVALTILGAIAALPR